MLLLLLWVLQPLLILLNVYAPIAKSADDIDAANDDTIVTDVFDVGYAVDVVAEDSE